MNRNERANVCDPPYGERRKRCSHAEDAADSAVKKTFAILGVDIEKPEQVESFRESLRFGDKLRKAADRGFMVLVGVLVVAMAAALWLGIVEKIKGGHG